MVLSNWPGFSKESIKNAISWFYYILKQKRAHQKITPKFEFEDLQHPEQFREIPSIPEVFK